MLATISLGNARHMSKVEYKKRLQETVDTMIDDGADRNHVLSVLIEITLDLMKGVRY